MFDAIERAGFVAPGRLETEIDDDIRVLAERDFGVKINWHKRIVRAGPNSICTFHEKPPVRRIEPEDTVYLDLGPVFGDWEADLGRSYALGDDPRKNALVAELPRQFEIVQRHFRSHPDITGAALYDFAVKSAEDAGWAFGGKIAGHIVGEYNHRDWPGDRNLARIGPMNPTPLSDPDHLGRDRYWILEIHLVEPNGTFAGFYERLFDPAPQH